MSLSVPDSTSRNRSASTGDSGLPQHEHKRPRLSDAQSTALAAPAIPEDTALNLDSTNAETLDSTNLLTDQTNHVKLDLNTPPRSPQQSTMTSPNSSKVTINTRPLSSQSFNQTLGVTIDDKMNGAKSSSTTSSQPSNSHVEPTDLPTSHGQGQDQDQGQSQSQGQETPDQDQDQDQDQDPQAQKTISISSSESGNPPIEVAAPENYDQDSSDTAWITVAQPESHSYARLGSAFVQRTFPYADGLEIGSAHKIIGNFSNAFLYGTVNDAALFKQVKVWLSEVVAVLPQLERSTLDAEHDFWSNLPELAKSLLRRESPLPSEIEVNEVVKFFIAYMRLTRLIADVETSRFLSYTGNFDGKLIRLVLTPSYTQHCRWFVMGDGVPLYQNIFKFLDISPGHIVDTVTDGMVAADVVGTVRSILTLFEAISATFSRKPSLVDSAMLLMEHTGMIVGACATRLGSLGLEDEEQFRALREVSTLFWAKANDILDAAIIKQHSWLTIDNCELILNKYDTFISNLTSSSLQPSTEVVAAAGVDTADFSLEDVSTLAAPAWKFSTLRKFIRNGRMELRVFGIGAMADELVKIYHAHIQVTNSNLKHPIVRFMVDFIRRNELVRYLVGVDSHAQIINRSTNVIGFLCVSHSYHDEDTNVIWRTAMECQDSRAGAEVLQVLQCNFDNLTPGALCHVTTKVLELPFTRFDFAIWDFTLRLLQSAIAKVRNAITEFEAVGRLNTSTFELCLRLLREANTYQLCSTDLAYRIRSSVPDHIKMRLEFAIPEAGSDLLRDGMRTMVETLCRDIEEHSSLSCGSVYGVFQILRVLNHRLSINLIHEFDIVRLIIQDLVHLSNPQNWQRSTRSHWTDFDCYFVSFPLLILQAPESFDQGLLDAMWLNLLSSEQKHIEIRSRAWAHLAEVLDQARMSNAVLDVLISKYFPQLSHDEYDEAVLRFAQQAVRYESRMSPPELCQSGDIITIPGIERVWAIMIGAPTDEVHTQASDFVIHEYLDSTFVVSSSPASIEATHLALVDRCVQQVIGAANNINSTEDVVQSADGMRDSSGNQSALPRMLNFHRSLIFLRRFLEGVKTRPQLTTPTALDASQPLAEFQAKGELLELTLQIHNHSSLSNRLTKWTVGFDNTGAEIWQTISDVTGWSQFTFIYRGGRLILKDKETTLRDMNFAAGIVMVSKIFGTAVSAPDRAVRAPSPVDSKIMHHFDDLHKLLNLDNEFAKEVYEFLIMFSSQNAILNQFRAMASPEQELLPVEKPFKLMYYLRALRSCIEDESFSAQPDTTFIVYAVRMMIATMGRLNELQASFDLRISIIQGLMEALVLAFRAKVSTNISQSYVIDRELFVRHIFSLWSETQQVQQKSNNLAPPHTLIRAPFEAIVEALLHDETIWSEIQHDDFSAVLLQALLSHPLQEVRQAILDVIYSLTGNGPAKLSAKANDPRAPRSRFPSVSIENCVYHMWQILLEVLPQACAQPTQCSEVFDAALSMLKTVGKKMDEVQLLAHVENWKQLLLKHEYQQNVGLPPQDYAISSLGKLLIESLKLYPSLRQLISDSDSFIRDIFSAFLFPPLSDATPSVVYERMPVLDMQTRQVLYDLMLAVSTVESGLESIVAELNNDLVPKDYFFQPQTSNERQALRSDVGYAGLRNLSNTCYLNSLFSQLFMNVEFRELVMKINIIDETKQKLVVELSKVFAHMQNSCEEAISPETAVDAITQWDGDQIDVTVQMDVDEFFNLLFDRLEFQILDQNVRNHFRSIYGGQLVQQIKSKECEHVSETLEPFSAVQVEIKGKTGLEDSLRAYVEGEVLQGENKYSCTGCGKHVDAVKRACLKDIPDHLIFNLKRFDYDIMTGMRCKINDEFRFPSSIDMSPYTLQALSNAGSAVVPDIFELVGIIVHSGTAESGHYYSYIRKRPFINVKDQSWVQFNDQDVTHFDPNTIGDCCFGGVDFGAIQCPKFYNGYMLFYQRKASLDSFGTKYTDHDVKNPVRLKTDLEMEQYINQQNELYLRNFVVQDATHAKFVKSLLQKLSTNPQETCSRDHLLESQVITMVLDYISSTSARWKELPEVEDTLKHVELRAHHCNQCAREIVNWCLEDMNFANSVVRCFYQVARKAFARLICTCWQVLVTSKVKQLTDASDEVLYESANYIREYEALLADFVTIAYASWDHILRHGRAWDQYFGILSVLTKLGDDEAQIVIDEGFLERSMELVHLHVHDAAAIKRLRPRYGSYLLGKDKNKPYGHSSLIQFVADLLVHVALDAPIEPRHGRVQVGEKFGLLISEASLLDIGRPTHAHWLRKMILGGHNPTATNRIVAYIAKFSNLNHEICACLKHGLLKERQIVNAVSFLKPTLTFVSEAVSGEAIEDLVETSLESVDTTGGQYGKEYLTYLLHLLNIENSEIPFGPEALRVFVLQDIMYWAPALLMHPNDINADVRGDTLELLNEILFEPVQRLQANSLTSRYRDLLDHLAVLLDACATYANKTFLGRGPRDHALELQVGQANHVLQVVETYLPLIMNTAGDEEKATRIGAIMDELKSKSESLVDELASASWKGPSSDLDGLSDGDLSEVSQ